MAATTNIWSGSSSSVWTVAGNWSAAGVPDTGADDTAIFDQTAIASVTGGDFTASSVLSVLQITSLFSSYAFGDNGVPVKVAASTVKIGEPSNSSTLGTHSGRINWDGSTVATTILVYGTKESSTDSGKEPVRIKAVNASNKAYIYAGRVGFATDVAGDVATFSSISVIGSTAVVNMASGVTLTTLRMEAGRANWYGAATMATAQIDGGTLITYGSGAITAMNVTGTADLKSTGTLTTLTVFSGGNVTMMNDMQAKTITTVKLYKGATFSYDPAVHTITNPIQLIGCDLNDVTINVPASASRTVAIV